MFDMTQSTPIQSGTYTVSITYKYIPADVTYNQTYYSFNFTFENSTTIFDSVCLCCIFV